MEIDMDNYTLTFDDIEVQTPDGVCLATGSVKIEYIVRPAEPDVGIMSRWVDLQGYSDIDVVLVLVDEDGEEISRKACDEVALYDVIEAYGEDWIVDEIQNSI
jgi:hypothetical protein